MMNSTEKKVMTAPSHNYPINSHSFNPPVKLQGTVPDPGCSLKKVLPTAKINEDHDCPSLSLKTELLIILTTKSFHFQEFTTCQATCMCITHKTKSIGG